MDSTRPSDMILLMAQQEAVFFERALRKISPHCRFFLAENQDDLSNRVAAIGSPPNLFAFLTRTIVPADILSKLGGAFNIHPAPPWMPGFMPTRKMVGNRDVSYGVTLHHMIEDVDAGPIIAVRRFDLQQGASLEEIEMLTYQYALQLALEHLEIIAGVKGAPHHPSERWGQR